MTCAGKTLSPDATKALAEALAFKDFSRWRRENSPNWHDMTFALGLGSGYCLYAHPEANLISGPTEFELVHEDGFMLCFRGKFDGFYGGYLGLMGSGCSVMLRLDRSVDPEAYAESIVGAVCKDRVTFTDRGGETRTAHVYSSEAQYAGDDKQESDFRRLSWELKQGLMRAAYAQDYSWIDNRMDEGWMEQMFKFIFWDTEKVDYSCRYKIAVNGLEENVAVNFNVRGLLCRDGDGLLVRSDDAVMTIPVSDEDMERFRRETGFMDTKEYLSRHPFRSYAGYARSGSGNQGGD